MTPVEEFQHSIRFDSQRCTGKMACMRACPTEAIRVRRGKASMLEDHCIDCGECLRVCPEGAIIPLTDSFVDFSRFRHTIAIPSPVLYTQFGRRVHPTAVLRALTEVGFDSYYDVALSCEATSLAISEFVSNHSGPYPLISPFCPTVVRLLQIRFPDLLELLIPIESPMETAAREAKEHVAEEYNLRPEEIGAIYVTACTAKMVAIHEPPRKSSSQIDGAIAISDIYQPLQTALMKFSKEQKLGVSGSSVTSGIGIGWARMDGLRRALGTEGNLVVSEIHQVIRIFEEIEQGRLKDIELVECHACSEGCISGSLTVENPYVARHRVLMMQKELGREPVLNPKNISKQFRCGYFTVEETLQTRPLKPLDDDIARAVEKMKQKEELVRKLPGIDCGVCGAPTCQSFAEDVVRERANVSDCFYRQREELEHLLKQSLKHLASPPGGGVN